MPLFEIGNDELVPFRRVQAGPQKLYEEEIEELLWSHLGAFVGVSLFAVARQPTVSGGLRPDIVALDDGGHVHVIEVKRDIARDQLAQCLEYAGWARSTSLDELAALFHGGAEAFFDAWAEFTDTKAPQLIQRPPQLVLVARGFDGRTDAALRYLAENGVPITVLGVTVYQDREGRRFVDVGADHEPDIPEDGGGDGPVSPKHHKIDGHRVGIRDLLDAGLIEPDTPLTWARPRKGKTYKAQVLSTGDIRLDDGRTYSTPSPAACEAAGDGACAGWNAWTVPDGQTLSDLRAELLEQQNPGNEQEGS